jgi:hypothetical protein
MGYNPNALGDETYHEHANAILHLADQTNAGN